MQPECAQAYSNRGVLASRMRNFARAVEDFDRTLELCPDAVIARFNRGAAHHAVGRLVQAVEDYDAVLARAPRHPVVRRNRGLALAASQRYERALQDLRASLRGSQQDDVARCAYAASLLGCGRPAKAAAAYRAVLRRTPGHIIARVGLGNVCFHRAALLDSTTRPPETAIEARPPVAAPHPSVAPSKHALALTPAPPCRRTGRGGVLGRIRRRGGDPGPPRLRSARGSTASVWAGRLARKRRYLGVSGAEPCSGPRRQCWQGPAGRRGALPGRRRGPSPPLLHCRASHRQHGERDRRRGVGAAGCTCRRAAGPPPPRNPGDQRHPPQRCRTRWCGRGLLHGSAARPPRSVPRSPPGLRRGPLPHRPSGRPSAPDRADQPGQRGSGDAAAPAGPASCRVRLFSRPFSIGRTQAVARAHGPCRPCAAAFWPPTRATALRSRSAPPRTSSSGA